jgi:four helix bundle protein
VAYRKFEELPAWRAAADLAVRVLEWCERGIFQGHAGLRDQIERASLSVSNNIAEGYERGTSEELLTFLYYARGSAGEVRSMLDVMARAPGWSDLREEINELIGLCLNISRQLGSWIESVKDSDYNGNRGQTTASRNARQLAHRSAAYAEELRRIVERSRQNPPPPDDPT